MSNLCGYMLILNAVEIFLKYMLQVFFLSFRNDCLPPMSAEAFSI